MNRSFFTMLALMFYTCAFADERVSGTISGQTWSKAKSPYIITNHIEVKSLDVEPGVKIIFSGNYAFEVTGWLKAVGTERDSILFTKADSITGWDGIFFNQVAPGSHLAYCIVEYSQNSGIRLDDAAPASSNLVVKNCHIRKNTAPMQGGGIYAKGLLRLVECVISDNSVFSVIHPNSGDRFGGGIYIEGGLDLDNCNITNNRLYIHGKFVTARGGGVFVNGSANFNRCKFVDNKSSVFAQGTFFIGSYSPGSGRSEGGGIFVTGSQNSCILKNCLVVQDSAVAKKYLNDGLAVGGGGIYTNCDKVVITNCTIAFNINHGLKSNVDTAMVTNSILYFNAAQQDFNTTEQISGNALTTYSNIENGYNGQSNLAFNPNFISRTNLQLAGGSPCVDTGKPDTSGLNLPPIDLDGKTRIMDGDGDSLAVIDMGCYELPSPTVVKDRTSPVPLAFRLLQNYPNPFNPETVILYELPQTSQVEVAIFNLLGERIRTLVNQRQAAGQHRLHWDGRNEFGMSVPSGVYLYRLRTGEFVQTRKMILMQ